MLSFETQNYGTIIVYDESAFFEKDCYVACIYNNQFQSLDGHKFIIIGQHLYILFRIAQEEVT